MNEVGRIQIDHEMLVARLGKPGSAILASMTPQKAHLLHMAVGIAGEAGELLDAIKKHVVYNKDLDIDNVIEELGDIEFYMCGLRGSLGIDRSITLEANIAKLERRYSRGYTDEAAQLRADKA